MNTLHHHKDGRPGAPGGIDVNGNYNGNGNGNIYNTDAEHGTAYNNNHNGMMNGRGGGVDQYGVPFSATNGSTPTSVGEYDRPSMSSEATYANNTTYGKNGIAGMTPLEMSHAKADGLIR